jgi:6-pyruvoyltetrahydropterin/6-carboxytetrahydropterin synthase
VVVKGEVNPETGFVMNLADLKNLIRSNIIEFVDHTSLNEDIDFLDGIIPSTENLAIAFWKILSPLIVDHGAKLHCVHIIETENNSVEYFGK